MVYRKSLLKTHNLKFHTGGVSGDEISGMCVGAWCLYGVVELSTCIVW